MTGPSPVDRGKSGSKLHVLTDRAGIPLAVAVSAANTNDAEALRPLVRAIPAVRSRRGPRRRRPAKLHADKAYDHTELRKWVRDRGIGVRIARKGIEPSDRLGRHRWVIERTISWLTGYPPAQPPLRPQGDALPGLPHSRRRIDRLQEACEVEINDVRQGLRRPFSDLRTMPPPLSGVGTYFPAALPERRMCAAATFQFCRLCPPVRIDWAVPDPGRAVVRTRHRHCWHW